MSDASELRLACFWISLQQACYHVTAGDDYHPVNTDMTQSLDTLREDPPSSHSMVAISDS